ncbi:MAG: polyprenyl synthetase family protein [Solirubrobacteraceae bacterium]
MSVAVGRTAAEPPAGDNSTAEGSPGGDLEAEADTTTGGEDRDAVEALLDRGGERLRERMARIETHLEHVTAAAGAPLAVHAGATIAAGGKRLRPLLVVLAAEAAEAAGSAPADPEAAGREAAGVFAEERLIRAAVAVELVHSATLVHDDVIDRAPLRRGRSTVVATAGRRVAVATGDLLFSRAFAELARNDNPAQLQALSDASSALAAGELLQREDAYAPRVALERYLGRCELKTAALFEAACRLGALVGAGAAGLASTELADALGLFARRIGLAFQILDDVLDVSGPVERTGKARGTDLLDGTVTLPLIIARERAAELAEFDLRGLRGAGADRVEELCDRIAATGALGAARARALGAVADAKAALPASLPRDRSASLERVADAVVERYS